MYRVYYIKDDGYGLDTKHFNTLLEATTFANEQRNLVIQIQHINKDVVKKDNRT
jgi:hypothetical protein